MAISQFAHTEDYVHIASWQAILSNLDALSRFSNHEQLDPIIHTFFESLESKRLVDLWTPGSKQHTGYYSAELLRYASFFEITAVRDRLLPVLLKLIRARLSEAFSSKNKTTKMLFKTLDGLNSVDSIASINDIVGRIVEIANVFTGASADNETSVPKGGVQLKKVALDSIDSLNKAINLLEILLVFPTQYFTLVEREVVAAATFIIECFVAASRLGEQNARLYIHAGLVSRKLGCRFMLSRDTRMVIAADPSITQVYVGLLVAYHETLQQAVELEATVDAIRTETVKVIQTMILKLLQRLAESQAATSGKPTAIHKTTLDHLNALCKMLRKQPRAIRSITVAPIRVAGQWAANIESDVANVILQSKPFMKLVGHHFDCLMTDLKDSDTRTDIESKMPSSLQKLGITVDCLCRFFKQTNDTRLASLLEQTASFVSSLSTFKEPVDTTKAFHASLVATLLAHLSDITPASAELHLSDWLEHAWQLSGKYDIVVTSFVDCVKTSDQAQYNRIAKLHKVRLQASVEAMITSADLEPNNLCGLLRFTGILLTTKLANDVSRKAMLGSLAMVLSLCAKAAERSQSLSTVVSIMELANAIVSERHLTLYVNDISLVIGIVQATGCNASAKGESHERLAVFDLIHRLLLDLLRLHREEVIALIPVFTAPLCSLLGVFRDKLQAGTARVHRRNRADNTLGTISMEPEQYSRELGFATSSNRSVFGQDAMPIFAEIAPLPVSCAANLSRVMIAMSQKPNVFESASTNASSSDKSQLAIDLTSQYAKTVQPFSKHAPFLLSRILAIQVSSQAFPSTIKEALREGVYALLDMCNEYGRNAVLAAGLGDGSGSNGGNNSARYIFKDFVAAWEKEHKYAGKT
eukprot:jgi/Hompol1/3084/HPOL_001559-RA